MIKCKNCGHRIRSLTVWDVIKHKHNQVFTHTKHDARSVKCAVKGCECENPEPIK